MSLFGIDCLLADPELRRPLEGRPPGMGVGVAEEDDGALPATGWAHPALLDGWHGDAATTIAVGDVPDAVRELLGRVHAQLRRRELDRQRRRAQG